LNTFCVWDSRADLFLAICWNWSENEFAPRSKASLPNQKKVAYSVIYSQTSVVTFCWRQILPNFNAHVEPARGLIKTIKRRAEKGTDAKKEKRGGATAAASVILFRPRAWSEATALLNNKLLESAGVRLQQVPPADFQVKFTKTQKCCRTKEKDVRRGK
jgi:hypothetical protein